MLSKEIEFSIRIGSMSFHGQKNTFADTTMERNTLMAKCYPRIKDYCREKHGLEFQVCLEIEFELEILNFI